MPRFISYAQAISEALVQAMQEDKDIFIFGLGVDDCKGIFGTTIEVAKQFAPQRVFDTPACENALTGIAIGAALNGKRPVLVHARHDFMLLALDQMINNAAKWTYTYHGQSTLPIVIRAIVGKGWGQGPTHSQNLQAVLAHFPGLIVAVPSNPVDVKGLFIQALKSNSPVVMVEHRALYDLKADVSQEPYRLPFGHARVVRMGRDVTVVATSLMVQETLKAATMLEAQDISVEVVDPVTLNPLDEKTILTSVKKTGHLLCADSDWPKCSFASEVAALVAEKAFYDLKAPIGRLGWKACPAPVSKVLEDEFYPDSQDIVQAILKLLKRHEVKVNPLKTIDSFSGPY